MILGCIADDFTGAGDIASILTGAGVRTALVSRLEDIAHSQADAVVVALKTRSIRRAEAVDLSLAALRALRAVGCRQFYFKYCSTFDSTADGNIGPVAEALAVELGASRVIVCPSFPANHRTVYHGHLFVGGTLLSESTMRHHPVTPMTDSDLRRWLALQCQGDVSHVGYPIVRRGAVAIADAIAAASPGLVLVDAICDDDLLAIGTAAADMILVTGGSALARGLVANFQAAGSVDTAATAALNADGPAIVLAGSCSAATNGQVARYRKLHPSFVIDGAALLAGHPIVAEADAFARDNAAYAPLIYSTIAPDAVAGGRDDPGFAEAGNAIEAAMAELAVRAVARGVRRIVVAGGETSGAVVEALRPGAMSVGVDLAPGVPILMAGGICYALKSGNFGDDDFFATALRRMETGR
jgi:uncharacterized protein YgbK (DUF1537 family)